MMAIAPTPRANASARPDEPLPGSPPVTGTAAGCTGVAEVVVVAVGEPAVDVGVAVAEAVGVGVSEAVTVGVGVSVTWAYTSLICDPAPESAIATITAIAAIKGRPAIVSFSTNSSFRL